MKRRPKVIGLLAFFDEPPGLLEACLTSLISICEHVVLLDGGYDLFPGAASRSDDVQEIISHASEWMGLTYSVPEDGWPGNEVEKRDALFRLGNAITRIPEETWFLVIDADMVVEPRPSNFLDVLAATDRVVGTYWLKDGEYGGRHPIRLLFKASPELRVTNTHYGYRLGNVSLEETGGMLAVETDLIIEHRGHLRSSERIARADEFDRIRERSGIESESPAV